MPWPWPRFGRGMVISPQLGRQNNSSARPRLKPVSSARPRPCHVMSRGLAAARPSARDDRVSCIQNHSILDYHLKLTSTRSLDISDGQNISINLYSDLLQP